MNWDLAQTVIVRLLAIVGLALSLVVGAAVWWYAPVWLACAACLPLLWSIAACCFALDLERP